MSDPVDKILELDDLLIEGETIPQGQEIIQYEWQQEVESDNPNLELNDDQKKDYNFARTNIRALLEKGNVALDSVLHIAQETKHPRAIEVASGLIKNMADLSKDLMALHKQMKDLDDKDHGDNGGESGETHVHGNQQILAVGSTKELLQLMKKQQQEEEENGEASISETEK